MDEITTVKNQVKFAGWISMVEECQNSGLSIRTWCKENNVCYKTYLYRLRRLRQMFLQEHSKEITPEITPLRMPQSLHQQLSYRASEEGVSLNQYIVYELGKAMGQ